MSEVKLSELKATVNIVDVIGKYLSLQKKGSEYVAMCCFHNDHKASLMVNPHKQVFKCFACGKGGDVIDFLTLKGRSIPEIVAELQGSYAPGALPQKKVDEWKQAIPTDEPAFDIKHYQHGAPSKVWRYTDLFGNLIGFVCRFDLPEGKQVLPYTLRYNGKHYQWMWKGFDKPRPLYNQYALINNPDKIVLIVEGEKTCDAAIKLFPEFVCVSWMGGARAYQHSNWSVLKGRNVISWPDADEPGITAMLEISRLLFGVATRIRTVAITNLIPRHWDLADYNPKDFAPKVYLKDHLYEVKPKNEASHSHATV